MASYSPSNDDIAAPAQQSPTAVAGIRMRLFTENELSFQEERGEPSRFNDSSAQILEPAAKARESLMQTFLRIRPLSSTEAEAEIDLEHETVAVVDPTTLEINAPAISNAYKSANGHVSASRYSFTRIFNEQADQEQLFTTVGLPMTKEVIQGTNCLMFCTGVTSSGKTYTVEGTAKQPGLLPRCLDVVFNSLNGYLAEHCQVLPKWFTDTRRATEAELLKAQQIKKQCLDMSFDASLVLANVSSTTTTNTTQASINASQDGSAMDSTEDSSSSRGLSLSDVDPEDFNLLDETREVERATVPVFHDCQYLIFVSFAEIYNENVYDLLEPCTGKSRKTKRVRMDPKHTPYIQGLREVQVDSIDEALRILSFGKRNRRVASTKLNKDSSRSHSIFTLKVVRLPRHEHAHWATVSRMTIVDLAGSERSANTKATGKQLREASNINKSLMTLSQCIKDLRYNQLHPANPRRPPFRNSKLTHIFQRYLEGNGMLRMVVNISPAASAYDETSHVLNFSAAARKVKESAAVASRIDTGLGSSNALNSSLMPTQASANNKLLEQELATLRDFNDTLQDRIYDLQQHILELESNQADVEARIREEVSEELAAQLVEVEETYQAMLTQGANNMENAYEKKIALLTHSVARTVAHRRLRSAAPSAVPTPSPQPTRRVTRKSLAAAAFQSPAPSMPGSVGAVDVQAEVVKAEAELALTKERVVQLEEELRITRDNHAGYQREAEQKQKRSAEELAAAKCKLQTELVTNNKLTISQVELSTKLEAAQHETIAFQKQTLKYSAELKESLESYEQQGKIMLELQEQLMRAEDQLESQQSIHDDHVRHLKEQQQELEASKSKLKQDNVALKDQVAQLQHETDQLKAARDAEQDSDTEVKLKAEVARLAKDLAKADTFEHEAKVLRAKNKALYGEIRCLKQEKLDLKQKLAKMQEQAVEAMEELETVVSRENSARSSRHLSRTHSIKSAKSSASQGSVKSMASDYSVNMPNDDLSINVTVSEDSMHSRSSSTRSANRPVSKAVHNVTRSRSGSATSTSARPVSKAVANVTRSRANSTVSMNSTASSTTGTSSRRMTRRQSMAASKAALAALEAQAASDSKPAELETTPSHGGHVHVGSTVTTPQGPTQAALSELPAKRAKTTPPNQGSTEDLQELVSQLGTLPADEEQASPAKNKPDRRRASRRSRRSTKSVNTSFTVAMDGDGEADSDGTNQTSSTEQAEQDDSKSNSKDSKAKRKRGRLGKRTDISSPLQPSNSAKEAKTATPKRMQQLLTPIARRLRPRRGARK
eukprot:TRINITY_DN10856_c0_g1_i2.p1 TRINITY_DN10856_c0_g1~~TRINITY_DN10856_c0_g1_i2.p1  ORF type:complete len:1307 (+),score=446.81 TRINITY_DN10856_c0_g1_i2:54-3923(+)